MVCSFSTQTHKSKQKSCALSCIVNNLQIKKQQQPLVLIIIVTFMKQFTSGQPKSLLLSYTTQVPEMSKHSVVTLSDTASHAD